MRRENGFTIVELMITLAISGFVMIAVYSAYRSQHKSYLAQEQTVTMQENLRAGIYFLQKGLRMAGFDPGNGLDAEITAAGSNSITFTRQFTEPFRDLDNSGDQNGAETFADYDGDGTWDSGELFTITYSLIDTDADGVNDALSSVVQGANLRIADGIQAIGFAYAFDNNPVDGELDTDAGGNTIWAVDTNADGILDLNLDTNGDGNIDAADDTDGNGTINGAALAGAPRAEDIRAVRVWLLARADREDDGFSNNTIYVVSNQVITPNDSTRREMMIMDIRCRNLGL
ncbi:putative Type II secretory pathway component PulJ-like protein [uncultured Desulfobacterium sp.]|uniref:Putative Type II secretory pathway component PulJ-like protein n=1 Tax=uncultured Desulfobacterium sp. TaxID=201089 RepID=A0A445N3K2_9BACT|nr:putative Type II secretory pathway component PulJ-like protein [uncultured Desulfobacterium sp.]